MTNYTEHECRADLPDYTCSSIDRAIAALEGLREDNENLRAEAERLSELATALHAELLEAEGVIESLTETVNELQQEAS